MTGKWDAWLREMQRAKKGGIRLKRVFRGLAFSHTISIPGDFSAATFRGQVRLSPDTTGTPLAEFTFSTPTYDVDTGRTLVTYSLAAGDGANSTGALPADGDGDGIEEFPFDILATPSGESEDMLFAGIMPVIGIVTQ